MKVAFKMLSGDLFHLELEGSAKVRATGGGLARRARARCVAHAPDLPRTRMPLSHPGRGRARQAKGGQRHTRLGGMEGGA